MAIGGAFGFRLNVSKTAAGVERLNTLLKLSFVQHVASFEWKRFEQLGAAPA